MPPIENEPALQGFRPVPDPTLLTTQQLLRELAALKELVFIRLAGMDEATKIFHRDLQVLAQDAEKRLGTVKELVNEKIQCSTHEVSLIQKMIETRLDGMDRALELLQSTADKFPLRIDEKIGALEKVHEEKLHSIQTQFAERDVRTESSARDSKVAVDAALQAAKEAVAEQNRSSALAIAKSETATVKQIDQQGLLIQSMTKAFDDKIDDVKERLNRIEGHKEGAANLIPWAIAICGGILTAIISVMMYLRKY